MSLAAFQLVCAAVLAIAYAVSLASLPREARPRRLLAVALLAPAAWLGEQSCMTLYGFYTYDPAWWGRLGDVPVLVPLIWPLVVLSARDVVRDLWPDPRPAVVAARAAALVVLDASLMEVVAVAAGYWRWIEGGYLGVPVIGALGWGCFALGAAWAIERAERSGDRGPRALLLVPVAALATTHAGLVALWWGALRWVGRGDLGPAAVLGFAPLALLAAAAVLRVRARRRLATPTTLARVAASAAFVALLASLGPPAALAAPWAHLGLVALPYLLAVRWGYR